MLKQHIITLLGIVHFTQAGAAQSSSTCTDPSDGQTYNTFSFKNPLTGITVTWMARNLNYSVHGSYAYNVFTILMFTVALACMVIWTPLYD